MPNIESAKKRLRQNIKRNSRNRVRKATLNTVEKSFRAKVEAKDVEGSETAFRKVIAAYDKAGKIGTVHANKVSRKKSRLVALLNTLKKPATPAATT